MTAGNATSPAKARQTATPVHRTHSACRIRLMTPSTTKMMAMNDGMMTAVILLASGGAEKKANPPAARMSGAATNRTTCGFMPDISAGATRGGAERGARV
jgi:hypothetical protein